MVKKQVKTVIDLARKPKKAPIQIILHTRGGGVTFHEVEEVDDRGVTIESPTGEAQRFLVGPKGYKVVRMPGGRRHLTLYEWLQAPPEGFYEASGWVEDPMVTPEWAKVSEDASAMKDLLHHDETNWSDRILFLIFGSFVGYTIATFVVPLVTGASV